MGKSIYKIYNSVTIGITATITARYLLGLTITTGAVVSLPFLYYSDTVVKKVGIDAGRKRDNDVNAF